MPSRSATVSTLVMFAAYTVVTFGLILAKGWNISLNQWVNPLKGYAWPANGAAPLCIPPGQLFPNGTGGVACGSSSQIYGPTGTGVNTAKGIPPNPATGKCPPGYIRAYGKCWSPAEDPIPPTGGGLT
jgi:hypothetical protein